MYLYEWSRLKELSKRICCYLVCLGRFFSLQSLRVDSVAQCFFLSHAFEFWKQLRSYFCCFQGPLVGYFLRNTAVVNQSVPGHHKRWLFAVDFRQFLLTEKQSSCWNQWGIQWYLEDSPSALTQTEQKQSSIRHKIQKKIGSSTDHGPIITQNAGVHVRMTLFLPGRSSLLIDQWD